MSLTPDTVESRRRELAEAERAYQASLVIFRVALPRDHIYISGSLLALGAIRIDQGRPAEAEPLLRQALARRVEKLGLADRRTARAQRALGLCLAALGHRVEAEGLLLESYRTLSTAKNCYHRTPREHTLQTRRLSKARSSSRCRSGQPRPLSVRSTVLLHMCGTVPTTSPCIDLAQERP